MPRPPDAGALSLQERYAPESTCFGCGPANAVGLHLRSFESESDLIAEWQPLPVYEAFAGVLNGGVCGTLMDCHANWAATMALMRATGGSRPPATVTAGYEVRLLRPTPTDGPLRLVAHVVEVAGRRAEATATIMAGDEVTATFRGTFVAVDPDHPGYHRWDA